MRTTKKVYLAFIDFQKMFDTINRRYLSYKFLKNNVTGNFYYFLKSLYEKCEYCVKSDSGLTQAFQSSCGVKQGRNLSPTLANIFQNDLHIFHGTCFPVELHNTKIDSLSWADDLVLMSSSREGLQNCLNRLYEYCTKWGLTVNPKKTVCLIFEKSQTKLERPKLRFGDAELEYAKIVKYLGIEISYNGSYKEATSARISKALTAINMCKQAFSTIGNVNTRVAMTAFDHQIMPILTYGCPIWGVPKANKWIKVENIPTSVTNVAKYSRDFINSVSETDIPVKNFKRVTKSAAAVETIRDKELFLQHYRKDHYDIVVTNYNTITRNIDFDKSSHQLLQICFKSI